MFKVLNINLFIFVILGCLLSVEAQRSRTLEDIVRASDSEHALNICRNRVGGNLVELENKRAQRYKCFFDVNIAVQEQQEKRQQQLQQQLQQQQRQSRRK